MFLRFLSCALVLAFSLRASFAQARNCNLVEVPVGIVNGAGESFHGLSADEFTARSGKRNFVLKGMTFDDGPRRIVLIVDGNRKLSADTRKAEELLVQTILDSARPQDSLALVVARGADRVVKFGEPRSAYLEALPQEGEVSHGKEQGVLDAVMQGIALFSDSKPGDAMIVIASDLQKSRAANPKQVAKALEEHHVRMFGLALGLVDVRNVAASGQATTAWGLATATPGVGEFTYETGDSDFYPLTRNSGGLVMAVMNYNQRLTFSMKDPKFQARVKQQAATVYNMIAAYYRMQVEATNAGEWDLELKDEIRQSIPNMFLLYPHALPACAAESHVAKAE